MNQGNLTFDSAKRRPGQLRSTKITDGLTVSGIVTGADIHNVFSTENLETMNIGYAQIFAASNKYHGKPLVGMTEAKGKLKIIDRAGFRWELSGGNYQKARVTQRVCNDAKPGLGRTTIDVVFDKPYFQVSDIVTPANNQYRLVVVPFMGANGTASRQHHQVAPNGFRYTFKITDDSPQAYLPSIYLETNQEWRKVSSLVATTDNKDGGGFQFYNIFESEGQVQQHAVQYSLDDKVARRVLQESRKSNPDSQYKRYMEMLWVNMGSEVQGKEIYKFMSVMDSEAMDELYRNVENTLMFGKESSTLYSPEGHQMLTASGLREQLEGGWTLQHNGTMSLGELEDWFDAILKDKVAYADQKVVLSAGTEFRKMFDRMVKLDSATFLTLDTMFIRMGQDYRHLDYGSYFSSYQGVNVSISVMQNPAYDNSYYCDTYHPVKTNVPIDSWRADILDFGNTKDQSQINTSNISMVAESYCDYNITYSGKYYAGHDGKSGLPITDGGIGNIGGVSGYTRHFEKSAGLMIADVTRCGYIALSPAVYR